MLDETIKTRGHTTADGILNLTVDVGMADADVAVTVHVKRLSSVDEVDSNGWPIDFFERVAGSMPTLKRGSQGGFEERLPFE